MHVLDHVFNNLLLFTETEFVNFCSILVMENTSNKSRLLINLKGI